MLHITVFNIAFVAWPMHEGVESRYSEKHTDLHFGHDTWSDNSGWTKHEAVGLCFSLFRRICRVDSNRMRSKLNFQNSANESSIEFTYFQRDIKAVLQI